MSLFKSLFCTHEWENVSEVITKSEMKIFAEMLATPGLTDIRVPTCSYARKHILVLKCSECGKVRKEVTEI